MRRLVRSNGGIPSKEELTTLVQTSKNYLDALKLKAQNKIVKEVEAHLQAEEATPQSIEKVLQEAWKDVTKQLGDVVDSESQIAKTIGLLNGIIRTNAAVKVDDPIVFFIVKKDDFTCGECIRLHLMDDQITPRLWHLSELSHRLPPQR